MGRGDRRHDRPGGVLRLLQHPPAGPPGRRRPARGRVADHRRVRRHDPGRRRRRAHRARQRAAAPLEDVLRAGHPRRRDLPGPPRADARRAAGRGAPHAPHADRRHGLRAGRDGRRRAAAVDVRRAHGHRGRAPRRGPLGRLPGRVAVGHRPLLRAGGALTQGRARRSSSAPPPCCRPGCRPPTSRSRPRPTSGRSASSSTPTRRRRPTSRRSRSATTRTRASPSAASLADEVERFLRDHND